MRDPEWTVVPVGRVLFVYLDGRYVGEVGRRLLARRGRRWWSCTGWESRRSRFPTREAALDSLRAAAGVTPARRQGLTDD